MTDPQSNPLLSDPSIVQVSTSSDSSQQKSTSHVDLNTLEPGNALSKLLDSAISKAAKEKSPEIELKSSSNTASPKSNKSGPFDFQANKLNNDKVYTIEELLSLRNTAASSITQALPPKEFWCLNAFGKKPHFNKEFVPKSKRNNGYNKRDLDKKKKPETPGFFTDAANADTEWNEEPEIDEKLKLEMGDTVEDFERWKESQRRKNDPTYVPASTESQQPSNDVDSFFSFVKTANIPEEKKASQETSKSSRFTSFFTPSDAQPEQNHEAKTQQPEGTSSRFFRGSTPSSNPAVLNNANNGQPASSGGPPPGLNQRSTSGSGYPIGSSPHQQKTQPLKQQAPPNHQFTGNMPPQMHQIPPNMGQPPPNMGQMPPGFPPGLVPQNMPNPTNDSFFMSLMSKQPNGEQPRQVSQGQPGPKGVPGQQAQPGLQRQVSQGQQAPQGPVPQQNQQNAPPWIQNGQMPPNFPPGFIPNQDMKNMQNRQYPFPPPGMFPPGFIPPGMQFPPQFRNDQNVAPNKNEQPPSGQMLYPPGLGQRQN